MDTPPLLIDKHPAGYAVLTLNRPQAMNALSRDLMAALADTVDALEADPAVRVLVLTGAGRAFCAGLDLKELGSGSGTLGRGDSGVADKDPVAALGRFTGPVIGAINGAAVTGGFELALACDVLYAGTSARFADTHARIGIAPAWGLSQKLPRAIGPYRAREVSFSEPLGQRRAGRGLGLRQPRAARRRAAARRLRTGRGHVRRAARDCCATTRPSSTTATRCRSARRWRWRAHVAAPSTRASRPTPSRAGARRCASATARAVARRSRRGGVPPRCRP